MVNAKIARAGGSRGLMISGIALILVGTILALGMPSTKLGITCWPPGSPYNPNPYEEYCETTEYPTYTTTVTTTIGGVVSTQTVTNERTVVVTGTTTYTLTQTVYQGVTTTLSMTTTVIQGTTVTVTATGYGTTTTIGGGTVTITTTEIRDGKTITTTTTVGKTVIITTTEIKDGKTIVSTITAPVSTVTTTERVGGEGIGSMILPTAVIGIGAVLLVLSKKKK